MPKRVATLVCDTGAKYLSKVYDDGWLAEQGLARSIWTMCSAQRARPVAQFGQAKRPPRSGGLFTVDKNFSVVGV